MGKILHVGERLKEERERLGLNQSAFAELAQVSRKTQFNYESGGRSPDVAYLLTVARIGVDIYYVVSGLKSPSLEASPPDAPPVKGELFQQHPLNSPGETRNEGDEAPLAHGVNAPLDSPSEDVLPLSSPALSAHGLTMTEMQTPYHSFLQNATSPLSAVPLLTTPEKKYTDSLLGGALNGNGMTRGECLGEQAREDYAHAPGLPDSSSSEVPPMVRIPIYNVSASAGHGALIDRERILDHLWLNESYVRGIVHGNPHSLLAITVSGDSMAPTLLHGDLILVDTSIDRLRDDAIYVLDKHGELAVKRVQIAFSGDLMIKSDNPAYSQEVIPAAQSGQIRVVGRVVGRINFSRI